MRILGIPIGILSGDPTIYFGGWARWGLEHKLAGQAGKLAHPYTAFVYFAASWQTLQLVLGTFYLRWQTSWR